MNCKTCLFTSIPIPRPPSSSTIPFKRLDIFFIHYSHISPIAIKRRRLIRNIQIPPTFTTLERRAARRTTYRFAFRKISCSAHSIARFGLHPERRYVANQFSTRFFYMIAENILGLPNTTPNMQPSSTYLIAVLILVL